MMMSLFFCTQNELYAITQQQPKHSSSVKCTPAFSSLENPDAVAILRSEGQAMQNESTADVGQLFAVHDQASFHGISIWHLGKLAY